MSVNKAKCLIYFLKKHCNFVQCFADFFWGFRWLINRSIHPARLWISRSRRAAECSDEDPGANWISAKIESSPFSIDVVMLTPLHCIRIVTIPSSTRFEEFEKLDSANVRGRYVSLWTMIGFSSIVLTNNSIPGSGSSTIQLAANTFMKIC